MVSGKKVSQVLGTWGFRTLVGLVVILSVLLTARDIYLWLTSHPEPRSVIIELRYSA